MSNLAVVECFFMARAGKKKNAKKRKLQKNALPRPWNFLATSEQQQKTVKNCKELLAISCACTIRHVPLSFLWNALVATQTAIRMLFPYDGNSHIQESRGPLSPKSTRSFARVFPKQHLFETFWGFWGSGSGDSSIFRITENGGWV